MNGHEIDSTIQKDLRLNFRRVMEESTLSLVEANLPLLALSRALKLPEWEAKAIAELNLQGVTAEQIQEAKDSAAIMGMLNTYYRFRHFVTDKNPELVESYKNAGLRMTVFAKPLLGKEKFEMLAFALSVLNGCETCVRSHEATLREAKVDTAKIHDLARLAAIVKGMAQ